jgi:hypothetical protein
VLVEVKGDTNIWDKAVYTPHAEKILKSGWRKNYLIVGASYKKGDIIDDWINIGVGDCGQFGDEIENEDEFKFKLRMIDSYCLIKNEHINNWDIFGNVGQFNLGINGSKDWTDYDDESYTLFENIWTISKNLVQWKGKQMNAKVIKKKVEKITLADRLVENLDGKLVKPDKDCVACCGSGISYWSDDRYGACMECC